MYCILFILLVLVFEAVFRVTQLVSRCAFHVKRVSRVTPRNVGISTCETCWLFNFSKTFSFAVDSVKSVLAVLVVLSCSAQLSVQLHTS